MLARACACLVWCHVVLLRAAEILMIDVENDGRLPCRSAVSVMCTCCLVTVCHGVCQRPVPSPERIDAMQDQHSPSSAGHCK